MRTLKALKRRLGYLWRRSRFERELEEEIRFHLETRIEELMEDGISESDARAQAKREFGRGTRVCEESRSAWQFPLLEDLVADLRYGARALRRSPTFAAAAVLSLALGIGANLAIFSLTMDFLFSKPSVHNPRALPTLFWA